MVNCCIYGCKSRSERNQPNITFHRFPNDPLIRNKWIDCTGRDNWHPSRHSRICSRHFEESCFRRTLNRTHLNPRALPTRFIQVRPVLNQPSFSKCEPLGVDMDIKDYLLDNSSMTDIHGSTNLPLPSEEVAMEIDSCKLLSCDFICTQDILPMVAPPEVHGEMKHITSGNCIPLQHLNILTLTKPEIAINKTSEKNRLVDNDTENSNSVYFNEILMKDHDYLTDPSMLTEFSKHIIVYIAGFVVSKLKRELQCEECVSAIISETKYASLQLQKDKGDLCYPSKDVIKICEICEIVFRKNRGLNKKNILFLLMQESLKRCLGLTLFFQ